MKKPIEIKEESRVKSLASSLPASALTYGYGCPYQFARDYLVEYGIRLEEERQVLRLAIEALDNHIRSIDL